ncbi:hypothetical protein pqer_cds_257 [Pandoravirus quercus]|uniref:Uncharacterized protein n=1 Tax=Pandoravirus quercus TaxID=2107709 RepID=A0A2U7U8D4_9VIRU|nr:hypothetical protein pqer_cds_257 [Pandoravirus quercus]AVK74679.1 hypothetical protein pqer_cds_257 [Pandoravirus quercus]
MQGNGDDDGFDWAALVPQGLTAPASDATQERVIRLDDDMARMLASAGANAIDAGYTGPLDVWSVRVQPAKDGDFRRLPKVLQECSTGCLDLQTEFTQQKARENVLIEEERRKSRERKRAREEIQYANMDPDTRAMAFTLKGLDNLSRCLNLHGGFMAKVQESLGRAANCVRDADAAGQGSRITPRTRAALANAIAEEHLHNWAYMRDVASLARDALLRELVYREVLDAVGAAQPFDAALAAGPMSLPVRNCLATSTSMGERGAARADYATFR